MSFQPGDLCFVPFGKGRKPWPARIDRIDSSHCTVSFYGEKQQKGGCKLASCIDFAEGLEAFRKLPDSKTAASLKRAIKDAVECHKARERGHESRAEDEDAEAQSGAGSSAKGTEAHLKKMMAKKTADRSAPKDTPEHAGGSSASRETAQTVAQALAVERRRDAEPEPDQRRGAISGPKDTPEHAGGSSASRETAQTVAQALAVERRRDAEPEPDQRRGAISGPKDTPEHAGGSSASRETAQTVAQALAVERRRDAEPEPDQRRGAISGSKSRAEDEDPEVPSGAESSAKGTEAHLKKTMATKAAKADRSAPKANKRKQCASKRKVETSGEPNRKMRNRANWLREIRRYQRSTEMLIPSAPFIRLVGRITQSFSSEARYKREAVLALQAAAEDYLCGVLTGSNLLAHHANRVTLMVRDIQMWRKIKEQDYNTQ